MSNTRKQSKLVREANDTIHRRNLYIATPDGTNRRVYNAHIHQGEPVVEDLHVNHLRYSLLVGKFSDGYGQPVTFSL